MKYLKYVSVYICVYICIYSDLYVDMCIIDVLHNELDFSPENKKISLSQLHISRILEEEKAGITGVTSF